MTRRLLRTLARLVAGPQTPAAGPEGEAGPVAGETPEGGVAPVAGPATAAAVEDCPPRPPVHDETDWVFDTYLGQLLDRWSKETTR